jgi:hypothetical protein
VPQTLTETLPLQGIPPFDKAEYDPEIKATAYDHSLETNVGLVRDIPVTITLVEAVIMPGLILQRTVEKDLQEV